MRDRDYCDPTDKTDPRNAGEPVCTSCGEDGDLQECAYRGCTEIVCPECRQTCPICDRSFCGVHAGYALGFVGTCEECRPDPEACELAHYVAPIQRRVA